MACGCGASCVQLQLSASVLWLAFTPHVMLWVHFVCRWTSLVVAAEVFRYVATQSPAAAANVWQYFNGMRTLNDITGIKVRLHVGTHVVYVGAPLVRCPVWFILRTLPCPREQGLFGRSYITPNETHTPGGLWTPSTAPGFEGWTWKADASSDELCGHLFAFTTVSAFMNGSAGPDGAGSAQEAAQYLVDIADYITSNGFYLIGEQGLERLVVHGRLESTSVCSSAAPH